MYYMRYTAKQLKIWTSISLVGLLGACTLSMTLPAYSDTHKESPPPTVYVEQNKCLKFVLPIEPDPPHIPIDQFAKSNQTKRTDLLVEHIRALKAHDMAYRKIVQDAFKAYQESCN